MRDIILNYKKDFLAFSIVSGLFFVFLILCWGRFGDIVFDCGREAYLPQLILQGKILYKEIFAMYNPLSYQINALLYLIFGASFNTLYFAGIVTTYLILFVIYLISRQFLSPFKATLPALSTICFCICKYPNCVDYIFPYSYGMIYSCLSFLCFVLFSLLFVKSTEKNENFKPYLPYLASFFMGISLACRYEFVLAYIPFLIYLFLKVKNIKAILINILLFVLPISLSFGFLFIQGFTIQDLVNYIQFGHNFFNVEEQKWYSKTQGYSPLAFVYFFKPVFNRALLFFTVLFFNIFAFWGIQKLKIKKSILFLIYSILFVIEYVLMTNLKNFQVLQNFSAFSWLTFSSLLILFIYFKKKEQENSVIGILLSLYVILSTFRIGFVYVGEYSVYFLPLALACNIVFVLNLTIKPYIKKSIIFFLLLISCSNFFAYIQYRNNEKYMLETNKGNIYVDKMYLQPYKDTLLWINENTKKSGSILVLPESPMLNFLTEHPTNNLYYHLIPNHIKAIGEEKIVNDLNFNKPDFIILQAIDYIRYGKRFLGYDYGLDIYKFINDNYEYQTMFISSEKTFSILIYKKKN